MGQTRVDLQHLLEDLSDAYPGALEETILTEIVANSLDAGASRISLLVEPAERTLVVGDNGVGMTRRELARYHDVAASAKTRGEGIGFAGVGIKLGLLVAEEVLTETRRAERHVATRWRLASRHKAPWRWVEPPGWVSERGTAVGLRLRNPLSPLLDPGYVEAALRSHFEPLLDAAFDAILLERYPAGVALVVNGRPLARRPAGDDGRASLEARLPRKRKASAVGRLARADMPLPEEQQGLAISTLGKVIRRGWDWLGLTPASPAEVGGLIEVPELAVALTLNKGDFLRTGRRGMTYLAYRKAIQEAVAAQLVAWGEARDQEDSARRRAARPLERDLERVLVDLADDFPALAALVDRRSGGQRRLPSGGEATPIVRTASEPVAEVPLAVSATPAEAQTAVAESDSPPTPAEAPPALGEHGPRRPTRYGLSVEFEERADSPEIARLVESRVLINTAHPAYARAVASRADGYHAALAVGMALAAVAVEAGKAHEFLTAFLARWGEALVRDGRRRRHA